MELWPRFADASFWWMHAMVLVWALFMMIVFIVEPLAHSYLASLAASDPAAILRRLSRTHTLLLAERRASRSSAPSSVPIEGFSNDGFAGPVATRRDRMVRRGGVGPRS